MSNDDSSKAPDSSISILVVDDSPDTLDSMAMLLGFEGFAVHTALSGAQALQRAEQQPPDVALIDISMPVMNGYELARRIRAQPWGGRIVLLALTGWDPDFQAVSPEEAGFDAQVTKPVDIKQLKAAVVRARAKALQTRPPQ
jgi:CheY-like chemotaxis protein